MTAASVHDRFALDEVADPVFVLAAPRSFSSVVCAMLGQHPELHGLPETHLFVDDTMHGWWRHVDGESYQMAAAADLTRSASMVLSTSTVGGG